MRLQVSAPFDVRESVAATDVGRVLCQWFHRDPKGQKRDKPHVWPPKYARATLHDDPTERETFLVVKSTDGAAEQDVQIKLRPNMIVLRRDAPDSWQGVIVEENSISVKVGDLSIRLDRDGSISRQDGVSTTWVEADGGVLKKTDYVDASISADGMELTRRTPENLTAITSQGLVSKDR